MSQTRIAANVELPVGFSPSDETMGAIVSQVPTEKRDVPAITPQIANGALRFDKVGLPDGSPGMFDPGWDSSLGVLMGGGKKLNRFLVSHGLGSPFIEDAKLCAALGSYWPGVAPDATRQYQPDKQLSGIPYPWPTAVPLTDEELGMTPVSEGKLAGQRLSWDGVRGPERRTFEGRAVVAYEDEMRVDYIDLRGKLTAALTSQITLADYKARTLAMAAVYWSLGIRGKVLASQEVIDALRDKSAYWSRGDRDKLPQTQAVIDELRKKAAWAVLSFRPVPVSEPELVEAAKATGATLDSSRRYYRFEVFRWGNQVTDPQRLRTVLVDAHDETKAYTDGKQVLLKRDGPWTLDTSIPT